MYVILKVVKREEAKPMKKYKYTFYEDGEQFMEVTYDYSIIGDMMDAILQFGEYAREGKITYKEEITDGESK